MASKADRGSTQIRLGGMVTLLCVAVSILLLWLCTFQTCSTYYSTPFVENFSRFVYPTIDKTMSKSGFLFSPLLLFFAGICSIAIRESFLNARYPRLRSLNPRPIRAVMLVLWSLVFFSILGVEHGRVMDATSRYPQRWQHNQPSWIDPFCSVVRFGDLFGK
jgi:hypothetical protein